MDGTLTCRHCGDVIGAYEPMIVLSGGEARKSSRAAAREAGASMDECYHFDCYAQANAEDPGLD